MSEKISKAAWYGWFICGLGALFYCYEYYLRITPSIMSGELMQAHRINAAAFGHLSAFYYYAYTPMQLIVGLLFDRLGVRFLMVMAVLACAIGSFFFANIDHLWIAQLGRFMVGFGSAFAFVGTLKLAALWLPPCRFALVSGLTTMLGVLGAILGDLSLTYFVNIHGWYQTIWLSGAIGILLAVVTFVFIRDRRDETEKTADLSWIGLLKGAFQLLKIPAIWINGFLGALLYLSLTVFADLWGIPYLQHSLLLSNTQAANLIIWVFLGWAVGAPCVGWLASNQQISRRRLQCSSAILAMLASIALLYLSVSLVMLKGILFFFGLFTSVEILVFSVGRDISPSHLTATSVALTNMFVMLGGVLLQPLVGLLLDWHSTGITPNHTPIYTLADYQFGLTLLPLGMAIAAVLALFLPDHPKE